MKKIFAHTLLLLLTLVGLPLQGSTNYPLAVNPPVLSHPNWVFGGHADYLYWRPFLENSAYAKDFTQGGSKVGLHELNFKFDSGFRVGFNIGLPCDEWRMYADWTHIYTKAKGHFNGTDVVSTIFDIPNAYQSPFNRSLDRSDLHGSADGHWHLHFDQIDVLYGREFLVGNQVTLKPYGGLSGLSLKQKYHSNVATSFGYIGEDGDRFRFSSLEDIHLKTHFRGIGLMGGLTSFWELFSSFGLYGDVSCGLYLGRNKTELSRKLTSKDTAVAGVSSFPVDINLHNDPLRATLNLAFGIEWRNIFSCGSNELVVRAGWEAHAFFRQNTFFQGSLSYGTLPTDEHSPYVQFLPSQSFSDLYLQGLVVTGSCSF